MKFVVLSGSPKGEDSVTLQYVRFVELKHPEHSFEVHHIGKNIKLYESNKGKFDELLESIKSSDGVIWAFPLYVFTVSSQYKRFIELIFERGSEAAFKGKYACLMATSVHFYDHTAINYMNGICDDLEMKYVDFYSAAMHDLLKEEKQKELQSFAKRFFDTVSEKRCTPIHFGKLPMEEETALKYTAGSPTLKGDLTGKKMLIIADSLKDGNVEQMIRRFSGSFIEPIETIVLEELDIKGGCLGCLRCGYNYECAYLGKDGFIDFYNEKVKKADIIIFAGKIKDRFLSATWKAFMDRAFFNTHTPTLVGKQAAMLISGPLKQIPNIRQIFEAYFQWQDCSLIGIVTDEYKDSAEIDDQISGLAQSLVAASEISYKASVTFLGVGGWKIFRDEMWGRLRFPFIADYKAYKRMKKFDFPQKDIRSNLQNAIMWLLASVPVIREEIYQNKMKSEMVKEFKKIIENEKSKMA